MSDKRPEVFPDYPYDPPVEAVWVVGFFEGTKAKSVLEHAHAGVGYILLNESGRGASTTCLVAFRKIVNDEPLPPHLEEVKDPFKIQEYEKRMANRS